MGVSPVNVAGEPQSTQTFVQFCTCAHAPVVMRSPAVPIWKKPRRARTNAAPRRCCHRPHPRWRAPEWWCASCADVDEAGNIASSTHGGCLPADRMLQTRPLRGSGAPWGALCPVLQGSCTVSTGRCSAGLQPRFCPLGLAAVYWTSLRATLLQEKRGHDMLRNCVSVGHGPACLHAHQDKWIGVILLFADLAGARHTLTNLLRHSASVPSVL